MIHSPALALYQATDDYLKWIISSGHSDVTYNKHQDELDMFLNFVVRKQIDWNDIFTPDTLKGFKKSTQASGAPAVRRLSRYLFEQNRIQQPIDPPYRRLPDPYEDYLSYFNQTRQVTRIRIIRIKRVLCAFHDYLEKHHIKLASIKIDQIDAFFSEFFVPFSAGTRKAYRSHLRGFLTYLYYPAKIIRKDLAPLVIGPAQFVRSKPPRFFRSHEIKQLFDSLGLSSAKDIRNYAMVHLAYNLGLRLNEISRLTLDDVSFKQSELILTTRKNDRPAKLPIPENTLKAISAYIIGARPESNRRRLFLNLTAPYRPISANSASNYITECIRKAGLPGTAYWLRHTYAQNLLEAGVSIYEIKEMLGHDHIDSTEKYLHIHIKLMRKVLFDEEI